jgi:hypothetical protein
MPYQEAQALEALAQALARKVKGEGPKKPKLRLIQPTPKAIYDSITRACILDRIRTVRRMWHLGWLVDQATFNQPNLDALSDEALAALLRDLERARECIAEGIPFEDAGLVRNLAEQLPDHEEGYGE